MYISELDLHGFKSFAYKTKVRFDSGITAIVGPNGCGKSNIVDALRWVLGEQRPSLLRSAAMSNVIFNGTARKKPLGLAEVSLSLINNRGILPVEYSEVTITRRLYRSGESEYLLNNTPCRLKDIMDLFMDTGMGADAYSVIELKMVEEILNDRNNDRRKLFEEAAGVTRYKEKRKQTLRKLDETLLDLQRIEDILVEVRKKTRSLELQAEKAEKANRLRSELEKLDKAWNRQEWQRINGELGPLSERIGQAEKEKAEIAASLESLEVREEELRKGLTEKERIEAELRKRTGHLTNTIRELESGLKITAEKIAGEEKMIRQSEEDIRQAKSDLEELKILRDSGQERLVQFRREMENSEKNLKESREQFSSVQQEYNRIRNRIRELETAIAAATREMRSLQESRIRLESRLENTEEERNRLRLDMDRLQKEIGALEAEREIIAVEMDELRRVQDEKRRELEHAQQRLRQLDADREKAREELRSARSERDALQSEIRLLRELSESREFFPAGVSWLMEHHSGEFRRLELVGSVLHTDEAHAAALDTALGETINYLIVADMEEARKGARLLRQEKKGRVTFIPLAELKESYPVEPDSILEKVRVEEACRPVAQLLLGSVLFAEDLDEAGRLLQKGGTSAVTRSGEKLTTHHFLKSGGESGQTGARLGLKDKIEKLEARLQQTEQTLQERDEALLQLERQMEQLDLERMRREFDEFRGKIHKTERELGAIESNEKLYRKNLQETELRLASLSESEEAAAEELQTLDPKREELQQKIGTLEKEHLELGQNLQRLEEEMAIAQNRYNDAQLLHQDLKNKTENLEKEIRTADAGMTSLQNRLSTREEMTHRGRERIGAWQRSIAEMEEEIEVRKEQKSSLEEELAAAEEGTSLQRGRIREADEELRNLRRKKEINLELVHHLSMAREKLQLQVTSLSDHIWETYGILMKQIEEELPEEMEGEEARRRIASLRQQLTQLGEVNSLAIEEFREEKERLEFLERQVQDLREAEVQLRETIQEINETATERFNTTFEQIRKNFISVFHTLFEEDDHCDLLIEQNVEDPLDAKIEIIAKPRGKRPSTINQLSGGEKTLTAIALLFAIYLVKPSPFCVLDEVDAPLDDANIERFGNMIRSFSQQTQFIIITHNKKTMSKAEMMYGVTMPETGVSRLVGVKLDEVA